MTNSIDDFLDFGDDHDDAFADELANVNRCEGSPSSEDLELNPLENSISVVSSNDTSNDGDLEMTDFGRLGTSLGSSWMGVNDSFSQMHVKAETSEKEHIFDDAITIPGSWPTTRATIETSALKNQAPAKQDAQLLQPTSFTMSQIAPPSLPQERTNSTTASSLCSEAIKEEEEDCKHDSDLTEPARKRRASETVRKLPVPKTATHKRTTSNASAMAASCAETALATPVGLELDESGDPIVARRQDRLMRNRAAALASRERKREHVSKLENSVLDLESDKSALQKQVLKMHAEILRLRNLLDQHNIEDESATTFDEIVSNIPPEPRNESSELSTTTPAVVEKAVGPKSKNAPTGFSPRGALKKSEIIANHIRAEEHLRNVTMKQAGIVPPERTQTLPVTVTKQSKTNGSNGSVVFMILIFGIALFAHTNPTGGLNLKGFSRDPSSSGLLLDLPQNLGDACPETVISQLRGQGFMLSEEIEELEARNLLSADTRAGSISSTTSTAVSEADLANWITTHDGGILDYEIGKSFTIAAPTHKHVLDKSSKRSSIVKSKDACKDDQQWSILECEIKRVQALSG